MTYGNIRTLFFLTFDSYEFLILLYGSRDPSSRPPLIHTQNRLEDTIVFIDQSINWLKILKQYREFYETLFVVTCVSLATLV